MASTYKIISSNTLSSGSSVSLTSIPQTYTDLILLCSFKSTHTAGAGSVNLAVGFNNDTTLANYSWRFVQSYSQTLLDNSSGSTGYSWAVNGTRIPAFMSSSYGSTSTNAWGNSMIYIPNYTSTTMTKSFYADCTSEDNTAGATNTVNGIGLSVCKWTGTAAISRIDLGLEVGNFANPSTVTLYGISKS